MPGMELSHDLPIDTLVRAYRDDGVSLYRLARTHHASPGYIRRLLRDAGVTIRTAYPRQEVVAAIVAEDGDEIERRYRQGESAASLARAYGVASGTLRRILIDRGVPRRGIIEARRLRARQQQAARRGDVIGTCDDRAAQRSKDTRGTP